MKPVEAFCKGRMMKAGAIESQGHLLIVGKRNGRKRTLAYRGMDGAVIVHEDANPRLKQEIARTLAVMGLRPSVATARAFSLLEEGVLRAELDQEGRAWLERAEE